MSTVAVIAHSGKSLDGGLPALRKALEKSGIRDPLWHEVAKSRQAPKQVKSALEQGADLIFVWGGDGMVQRCVDVVAGSGATMAIVPAGTANLFASNLGIPKHIDAAVDVGLNGARRKLDVGRLNGEMFAVMAGVGFDARVIRDASPEMKRHFGRCCVRLGGREEPPREAVRGEGRGRRRASGTRGWRAWFSSATSAMRSPASRRSRTLSRTTDCSRSASAARTASSSGAGLSPGVPRAVSGNPASST